jgi:hypothetical protein
MKLLQVIPVKDAEIKLKRALNKRKGSLEIKEPLFLNIMPISGNTRNITAG